MGIMESYSRATRSSNLKNDATHYATEKLGAVALVGTVTKDGQPDTLREMGALLFRVKYANDHSSYRRLREAWTWDMEKRAALDVPPWPAHIKVEQVAATSLNYWLNDLCPYCGGKGVKKMKFVDVLSDDPCDFCHGTAKRTLECEGRIKPYVLEMVDVLKNLAIEASHSAMARLNTDMDLK
ncbi:MAG: hypothetical protein ACRYF5_06420 [Janthinobacterium lividum]